MLSLNSFVVVCGILCLCNSGEATCSSNADCVSFSSVTSDRRYCCGGNFCCTFQQFQMGITTDPFQSMSIAGIVGIVAGIVIFLSIVGVLIYCLLKGARKGSLNRAPRSSRLESPPGTHPGHAVPESNNSPIYDYPPDSFDVPEPRKNQAMPPALPCAKTQTIPTVIGTFDRWPSYDRKCRSSRYAYDGPLEHDHYRREHAHHHSGNSHKRDYSPNTGRKHRIDRQDRHRREEYPYDDRRHHTYDRRHR